ncbi:MAG: hypothetical protein WBC22_19545 [Sedimentisphaerales bacterium]
MKNEEKREKLWPVNYLKYIYNNGRIKSKPIEGIGIKRIASQRAFMTMITQEQFKFLLPLAAAWAEEQEGNILRNGVPLTESQMADARTLGVSQPERIRLMNIATIPVPEESSLKDAVRATQLITSQTAGLTLRYGIFIRSDFWGYRRLIVHELVHTSQYEKLGGFLPFLQEYLHQCITIGYPAAPMEQEAINMAARIIS